MPLAAAVETTWRRVSVARLEQPGERLDHHQIGDGAARRKGTRDVVEEDRADDAAGPPDLGDRADRQVPVPRLRGRGEHGEALGIGGDLAGEQRLLERGEDRGAVAERGAEPGVGLAEELLAGEAEIALGGEPARRHRRLDHGRRNAEVLRLHRRPAAGALLAGGVEDDLDHRLAGLGVLGFENLAGDLDEVGFQPPLVPLGEDVGHLGRRSCRARRA